MAVSFVAAGASSATDGGSAPTPALPAGLAADDSMIAVFYSREATDGTVSASAGWNEIYNARSAGGLLGVWERAFQTGDAALTFTLGGHVGGAAGDDCIAQIAAWRGTRPSQPVSIPGTIATNAAAADIGPIGGVTAPANGAIVVVGGKLDDWTSVAVLAGDGLTWAEIGEPVSVAGADAGLVWDYALISTADVAVADKTFTVTGGTAVAGKGVMFGIAPAGGTKTTRTAPYTSMLSSARRISRTR